jgi:hypothetical protein
MPLLAYFAVVGTALLGLLYVAQAQLGPPKSLDISTNFQGVPQPWKAERAPAPVLTVRDAPVARLGTEAFAQSKVEEAKLPKAEAASSSSAKVTRAAKSKRSQKTARKKESRGVFARGTAPRQIGAIW